jgi:hypothetical protein
MLRQKRVGFGEHVQWACDIQGLHTIKYDNGDFHFVTFIDCKHAHGSPCWTLHYNASRNAMKPGNVQSISLS